MEWKRPAIRFLIFAILGVFMEVVFTGMSGLILEGNISMNGHSSPWMMLDYGLLGILVPFFRDPLVKRQVPLFLRAVVYMLGIFFVEYVSGIVFHKVLGLRIWDYSHLPYNLHGQITLIYTPFWYGLGLGVEKLYEWVDKCAWVILTKSPVGYSEK